MDTAVRRERLIELFGASAKNGWQVGHEKFPDCIGEADQFWPAPKNVFRALEGIGPREVRYLILGLDPYPTTDSGDDSGTPYATGVAFDINDGCRDIPDSLAAILRHVPGVDQVAGAANPSGIKANVEAFRHWIASRKILMLNCALSVQRSGKSGCHLKHWKRFIISIIRQTATESPGVDLIAWGAQPKRFMCDALEGTHVFTCAGHPQDRRGGTSFRAFWGKGVGLELAA